MSQLYMNGISTCLFKKKILLATILMEMIIWKNTAKMITWIREFENVPPTKYRCLPYKNTLLLVS